jgi:VWFA-related protein
MSNAILTALINGALVSALSAAAIRIGLALAGRRFLTAAARYALWWTALAATVLLPLTYLRIPHAVAPLPAMAIPTVAATPAAIPAAAIPVHPHAVHVEPASAGMRFPVVITAGAWSDWLLLGWSVVSGLMLLRLAASCLLLSSRKRGAAPIEENDGVPVMSSNKVRNPVLAGLRHPAILIPSRLLAELEADELEQIILHESAHLARHDDYALVAQRAIQAVFVFHPVVQWITRQIDLEREIACDEFVVNRTGLPRRYAFCLTRVVELCGGVRESWAGAGVAGRESQLAQRVDRLLSGEPRARFGKARVAWALCLVAGLTGIAVRLPGAIALARPAPAAAFIAVETPVPAPPVAPVPEALAPAPVDQGPVTPAGPPPVVVDASVQDQSGLPVTGLTRDNFQIYEDNVQQDITDFSVRSVPLSIAILVDVSGSMRDKQALVNLAVMQLVKSANADTEFQLFAVNTEVRALGTFRGDPLPIQNILNQIQPRGGTSLREGIAKAREWQSGRQEQRRLVVISDGTDNSSSTTTSELNTLFAYDAQRTQVSAITLVSAADYRFKLLQEVASQTHGHEFVSDSPSEIQDAASRLAANGSYYMLKYQSNNTALDASYRKIRVKTVNTTQGLRITFRDGYYADK